MGVRLTEVQVEQLIRYMALIQKWNQKFNLVGTSDTEALLHKHILDSLAVVTYIDGKNIIDVGSGAGLPGIPLAITLPKKQFTLIDTNGKKARFMRQAVIELKLENVQVIHGSVHDYRVDSWPDTVIARAFMQIDEVLATLLKVCADMGKIVVMLGKRPEELPFAAPLTRCLIHKLTVPGLDSERHVLVATKASPN